GSALTRFEIWSAALRAIRERPIFGWGADTFRLVFPMTKPLAYTKDAGYLSVADNVHDYPLQLGSAIGVPGFLLLYGLFGWVLYQGLPNAFSRGRGADRLIVTGFWAAALGYIVHLMFGLSVTGSTVFLWLALALILAPTATVSEHQPRSWGPAVAVLTAATLAFASVFNVVYIVADNYYLKAQFGRQSGSADPLQDIQTAIRLNPFNDMYRSQLGQVYQEQMSGWVSQARTQQGQGQDTAESLRNARSSFDLAEAALLDAIDFVPTEYDNYVFLAALYNQAGSYFDPIYFDKAVATADKGIKVEPFGPAIRFQKALGLLSAGRTDEGIKVLEGTITMDPAYSDPISVLGDAYAKAGRLADARKQYEALLKLSPANTQAKQAIDQIDARLATGQPTTPTP
ncbi:MAG TPA: O-antigen ligase family protein, partial [Coriobacteriia bacterium]